MSVHIFHKKDINGKPIQDEVFVNTKFLFLSNYPISKPRFNTEEQQAIEAHLKALGYDYD